jgi:hypothetical protein
VLFGPGNEETVQNSIGALGRFLNAKMAREVNERVERVDPDF